VQPIGTAIPGAQAVVSGRDGTPCGIGEVGEILIRTPYRSLGYVNSAATPAGSPAWQVNPATADPNDLLYHTGDLGRYRLDGSLDILGRVDRQVKIRGVRVETEEVSAVAANHPAVQQAVVTTQLDDAGHLTLVGYLVAADQTPATTAQLRSYLGKRLPAAMVPSEFMFVEQIPRTPNGKIAWAALPPVQRSAEAAQEFVAPRTETERTIAAIMATLLRRSRIGALDSFFALGGHSLLAMQLVSRITSALHVTLPLQTIFESPTVGEIAAAVDAAAGGRTGQADTAAIPGSEP
jgi:acyl carrier protein